MDMKLDKDITDRLLKINWLSTCGSQEKMNLTNEYVYIKNKKDIQKTVEGVKWGNTCMNATNELTVFLSLHHVDKYHFWNPMVYNAKDVIVSNVAQVIKDRCKELSIPDKMVDYIFSNIVNIVVTYSYKQYYELVFYDDLLKIYEAGHLPCGWIGGKYPNGKFKIY